MIGYFPSIYEDELFYSIITRYHLRSLSINERKTLAQVGLRSIQPIIPKNMNEIINKLKYFGVEDKEDFVRNHTLYGFYEGLLDQFEAKKLLDNILEGNGHLNITISKFFVPYRDYLKYCEDCVNEDIHEYGETYWRMTYQIPTIMLCPSHQTPLKKVYHHDNKRIFITASDSKPITSKISSLTPKTLFFADLFLSQTLFILEDNINISHKITPKYLYFLFLENGDIDNVGGINVDKLEMNIIKYIGLQFLKYSEFNLEIFNQLREDPLYYMDYLGSTEIFVFINYLSGSLKNFLQKNIKIPTGESPPFKCLNPFCEFRNKRVINNFRVYYEEETTQLNIIFICNKCSFEYEKIFSTKDWKIIETAIYYSDNWKSELLAYIYKTNLSIKKIAHKINLSSIDVERTLLDRRFHESLDDNILLKRSEWLHLMSDNLKRPLVEIKHIDFPLYAYLICYDNKWLKEKLSKIAYQNLNNIDNEFWKARDRQILLYLKGVASKGIIRKKVSVYVWMKIILERVDLYIELPYLNKTSKYLMKHEIFFQTRKCVMS